VVGSTPLLVADKPAPVGSKPVGPAAGRLPWAAGSKPVGPVGSKLPWAGGSIPVAAPDK
jgi:hypothetical protein